MQDLVTVLWMTGIEEEENSSFLIWQLYYFDTLHIYVILIKTFREEKDTGHFINLTFIYLMKNSWNYNTQANSKVGYKLINF